MCFCLGKNTIYSKYSTNNNKTQVKVSGWRNYKDTGESSNPRWVVQYNETHTRVLLVYTNSQTIPTSATDYGTELLPDSVWYLRPCTTMMFPVYNGAMVVIALPGSSKLQRRTISGTSQFNATSQYWQIEWTHQGLP